MKARDVYLPKGTKGIIQMTDKLSYLDSGASGTFQAKIESTIYASYFQMMEQHFHIEVWDTNSFTLNSYLGYESIPLIDIARGNIKQQVNIYDKIEHEGENSGKIKVTLTFTLVFEEIYDYMIKFIDWRTSTLENRMLETPLPINPKLDFKIDSKRVISNRAQSNTLKNAKLPYWQEVGQGIIYRGTYSQLQ